MMMMMMMMMMLNIMMVVMVNSYDIQGKIIDGNSCDRVSLNHGMRHAFCKYDNSFTFHDVQDGTYALEIESTTHRYPQYKLNIGNEKGIIQAIKYEYPGSQKERVKHPLKIEAVGPVKFYEIRQGVSFWGILRSPTILMMLPMVGMMFCFKYLVDPEELKKMQQQQAEEAKKVASAKKKQS